MQARRHRRSAIAILPAVLLAACGEPSSEATAPPRGAAPPYVDVTDEVGIEFVHFNGMSGAWYFAEIMGAGAALLDYDDDGDLDLYLVQGRMLPADGPVGRATFPPEGGRPLTDRLLRNELVETGRLRFTDVTETAAIVGDGYGMGVAAGDVDGDGDLDLYVTNLGSNRLWRNRGNGTFEEVTRQSGADDPRWSTGASFLDYDRDGDLDLYVCNYVDYRVATHRPCRNPAGLVDYCSPQSFDAVPDRLLRNRGDGTFEDVTAQAGMAAGIGAGLGVVSTDLDGDGWIDLYVANDGHANMLWINRGDGTFEDRALIAGCALNRDGMAEAGMGVDAGDYDGDGSPDLFLSHLARETNTLYRNLGRGWFEDATHAAGLGGGSLPFTGFGTGWVDFDGDGWLDLVVVNGAVTALEDRRAAGDPLPLDQRNQLFRNRGDGTFEDWTETGGKPFAVEEVGRALAIGDVDNDGDDDLLLTNNAGRARLLLDRAEEGRHWIGLELADRSGHRGPPGARVEVVTASGRSLWRRVRHDGSYLAVHDRRVRVGLGDEARLRSVSVRWPDGSLQRVGALEVDRYHRIEQQAPSR